jgi:hypothetical protein
VFTSPGFRIEADCKYSTLLAISAPEALAVPASRAPTVSPVGEIQLNLLPSQVKKLPPEQVGEEMPIEMDPPKATVPPMVSPPEVPIEIAEFFSLPLRIDESPSPILAVEGV